MAINPSGPMAWWTTLRVTQIRGLLPWAKKKRDMCGERDLSGMSLKATRYVLMLQLHPVQPISLAKHCLFKAPSLEGQRQIGQSRTCFQGHLPPPPSTHVHQVPCSHFLKKSQAFFHIYLQRNELENISESLVKVVKVLCHTNY